MCKCIVLLLLSVLLASCREQHPNAPFANGFTQTGVPVVYPEWLWEVNRQLASQEIDAAGLPSGWTVVITVPIFPVKSSPTGLARGSCDYERKTITVGWRAYPWETIPVLPALEHEVQHAVTGDPNTGH